MASEYEWWNRFFKQIAFNLDTAVTLYCDNQQTEALSLFAVDSPDWTANELRCSLRAVVNILTQTRKMCLFIDGLDEFEGSDSDVVEMIMAFTESKNIKVLIASRPLVEFEAAFETKPHLRLESLTRNDISKVVSEKFATHPDFEGLRIWETKFATQFIENIVTKASGVFLWVHLVVSSLLAGMTHGDRVSDLQKRLDLLLPDLENLYAKILNSLDEFYLEHAAQYILLMEASRVPLPLQIFYFADEKDIETLMEMKQEDIPREILHQGIESMARRVNSLSKGLLEINWTTVEAEEPTVQFLHRTVKEFLQSSNI
ncbi:hypothetical protein EJ04DRAFT_567369 [Polyplosphaeria fusca]|uniref:NACHT domain-containing protein n=1 Tax=Polyplosphaeria fusca TaxID=682080 RepID=A0A9P4QTU6_9PLEO|nr:hypothetical protein EJ04DRAFT_567369 [Polyplosphaeria fusca]